jgi:hypothetical protein
MEIITAWIMSHLAVSIGGSIGVVILTWILKKVPTETIRDKIHKVFFAIGAGISGFFIKWKYTKAFWNSTFEPWLIGFLDMIIVAAMQGLFDGLRSDNE